MFPYLCADSPCRSVGGWTGKGTSPHGTLVEPLLIFSISAVSSRASIFLISTGFVAKGVVEFFGMTLLTVVGRREVTRNFPWALACVRKGESDFEAPPIPRGQLKLRHFVPPCDAAGRRRNMLEIFFPGIMSLNQELHYIHQRNPSTSMLSCSIGALFRLLH